MKNLQDYDANQTAKRIKTLARKKNIPMSSLQQQCGLSINAVSQSAKSQEGMKARNIFLISKILNCTTDYLLGCTDNPNSVGESYINGDYGIQAVKDSSIVVTREYTENFLDEFFEEFKKLGINQKIKVMNYAVQLSEES